MEGQETHKKKDDEDDPRRRRSRGRKIGSLRMDGGRWRRDGWYGWPILWVVRKFLGTRKLKRGVVSWLSKMAKSLSIFLFFFFSFLLPWTYYTEESVGKCHFTKCYIVMVTWQEVTASYHMMSHDRRGKIMHRPCSSCISSVENLTGTLSSSPCQTLIKEQLA